MNISIMQKHSKFANSQEVTQRFIDVFGMNSYDTQQVFVYENVCRIEYILFRTERLADAAQWLT